MNQHDIVRLPPVKTSQADFVKKLNACGVAFFKITYDVAPQGERWILHKSRKNGWF